MFHVHILQAHILHRYCECRYRQVLGAMQLVWLPSKNSAWYFLKVRKRRRVVS